MKVFVTGATGFIGTAIVRELMDAGHSVIGLARNDKAEAILRAAGARVHRGTLEDTESLKRGAAMADGAIHAGFIREYDSFDQACEIDRQAVLALGTGLKSADAPLVITSTLSVFNPGRIMYEYDEARPSYTTSPRIVAEEAAAELLDRGVKVMLMRLPSSVHGNKDPQYVPGLISLASEKGMAAYVEDGSNRWTAIHLRDAARLFRLALEKGTPGARYHGVAERGIPFRDIAEVIGRGLGVPVHSLSGDQAADYFAGFASFASGDYFADNAATRLALGWEPEGPTLVEDLAGGDYFDAYS